MNTLSAIIPIYNEQQNIPLIYTELKKTFSSLPELKHEIIFVNDGSRDNSWEIIKKICDQDTYVKGVCLSRNFGQQAALRAGYDIACGDAAVSLDADLQDPPSLIPAMVDKWQKGAHIVYARRIQRHDSFLKKMSAQWYYSFLDRVADIRIPRNVGDFRLVDRQVIEYLKQCKEKSPYLRGIVAWSGFHHEFIDFNRPNRQLGTAAYTWSKSLKLAFDGLASFSLFPLKLAAFVGIFIVLTGIAMFLYISIDYFLFGTNYPLFKWLVTLIYIFMGIQFLLLWILGEYIGRIFEQQKNRPLYIVKEHINISTSRNIG